MHSSVTVVMVPVLDTVLDCTGQCSMVHFHKAWVLLHNTGLNCHADKQSCDIVF